MMSNSNGRSPIMMNIKDNSPLKKICKVARRGTKMAATAAHNGSQFYEQVQTRMAEVDKEKSPSRQRRQSSAASNGMASSAYRSRVRDQINRFNSAGATSQSSKNDAKEHRRHEEVTRRHHRHCADDSKNLMENVDRNETPSYNPNNYEKENESNPPAPLNETSSYSFTTKDGIKALSPAMHRQRKKSPKKTTRLSFSSPKKASSSSPKKASPRARPNLSPNAYDSIETCDETEQLRRQLRALEKDNEKLMKRNSRLERKCDKLARDNTQLMEEAEVHQAARSNNGSSSSSSSSCNTGDSDSHSNTFGTLEEQSNKRDPEEHPLIGSPLRKHMKLVHESAQSNCTVTMTKAPFPLLPPAESRAILEARKKEQEDAEHLNMMLGTTDKPSLEVDANFALSYKKRRGKRTKDGEGSSGEEEEAVDLLTSAAFMFKTSRRNLL